MIQGVGPYLVVTLDIIGPNVSRERVEVFQHLTSQNTHTATLIIDMGDLKVLKNRNGGMAIGAVNAEQLIKQYTNRYV